MVLFLPLTLLGKDASTVYVTSNFSTGKQLAGGKTVRASSRLDTGEGRGGRGANGEQ